jgi:folate-binding protein YgfZ
MVLHVTTPAAPFVVGPAELPEEQADALLSGTLFALADAYPVDVTGPGAVTCLQGLLTNDVEAAGDGAFLYGALLSPKGMIRTDLWAARAGTTMHLTLPAAGRAAASEIFERQLPPRLARVTARDGERDVLRLAGPGTVAAAERAGIVVPAPGRTGRSAFRPPESFVCRPPDGAPFTLELHVAREHASAMREALLGAGAVEGTTAALDLARILEGWPRLGAEIDAKTLPQEVRYDEINGVSYTKGCYTGQETVARLHFRGHANRLLRGLAWQETPDFGQSAVVQGERTVGRVGSIAWCAPYMQYLGLAVVRRDTDLETPVQAAGAAARVSELPFRFSL